MNIDLSIVIVSYNTKKLLLDCINSVLKFTKGIEYEIVVVDNASDDGSAEAAERIKSNKIRVIKSKKNLGFTGGNNRGIKESKGRFILLLNSDTKLLENSLAKMVEWMDKNPQIGVLTCTLVTPKGDIQPNGGSFPTPLRIFLWATFLDDIPGVTGLVGSYHSSAVVPLSKYIYTKPHQNDWVSGAVFLVRGEVVKQVGVFDDKIFMYGEDVEYCYRIKSAGWQIWYTPATKILHVGSASGSGGLVRFAGASLGKRGGIVGEFHGLKYFYRKHYPSWQYLFLRFVLKLASLLRIVLFGILGGQKEAIKIYAEAFRES